MNLIIPRGFGSNQTIVRRGFASGIIKREVLKLNSFLNKALGLTSEINQSLNIDSKINQTLEILSTIDLEDT